MAKRVTFDQLLDAVEHLPPEEQSDLIAVVQRRLAERGRRRVISEVKKARADFKRGAVKTTTAKDLMREIKS